MALTNSRLALVSYALSAGGTSGFSLIALSYVLSAPNDFWPGNIFAVTITNGASTAPLLIELRSTWTDGSQNAQTVPLTLTTVSNTQTFGNSGMLTRTAALLLSGQGAVLPFQYVVGSALQVVLMAASTVADAAGCSGQIGLWRAQ